MRALLSKKGVRWSLSAVLLLLLAILILGRAVDKDFNHDEHQFVAPAMLLSEYGLLPYRDFALFHLPNQTLLYAGLNLLTSHATLAAKLVSAAATLGMLVLLWRITRSPAGESHHGQRLLLGIVVIILLITNPTFVATAGKTWNHEVPALLTVLALLLVCHGLRAAREWTFAVAGLALGLAVGFRLTVLPILLPVGVYIMLCSGPRRRSRASLFAIGSALAMLPSLHFYLIAQESFMFSNLEAPRVRLLDADNSRMMKAGAWWRKFRFFAKEIMMPGWPLFLSCLLLAIPIRSLRSRMEASGETRLLQLTLLVLPFALFGCFAPGRYQEQHFYVVICLVALALASAISVNRLRAATTAVLTVLAIASSVRAAGDYSNVGVLFTPGQWYSTRMEQLGARIRDHVGDGPVLTMAPTWPLEAGVSVYPEFILGPFAWRMAHLVPPERRQRVRLLAPEDLPALLARRPPAGILTGYEEPDLEAPFVQYAEEHSFVPVQIAKKRMLWVRRDLYRAESE